VFTNVQAPEILDFIHGNDRPPTAPRVNTTTFVRLVGNPPLYTGMSVACRSGNWDGAPSIAYTFVDRRNGQVLAQSASGSLVLTAQMVGASLACRAVATNAGGSAAMETLVTESVSSPPPLEIERVPTLTARRGRTAQIRIWLDPAEGVVGKHGVCVTPPARVAGRGCASLRVDAGGGGGGRLALTVSLRIDRNAPLGVAKLAIAAAAGPSRAQARALLRVVR
jgi:hypothetical protein